MKTVRFPESGERASEEVGEVKLRTECGMRMAGATTRVRKAPGVVVMGFGRRMGGMRKSGGFKG